MANLKSIAKAPKPRVETSHPLAPFFKERNRVKHSWNCKRISFLGTPMDLASQSEVISSLESDSHSQSAFKYIVTPNADHIVRNAERPQLTVIYDNSWLSLCDSKIVARIAKMKGYPVKDVVTGSDLTASIFQSPTISKKAITIIGGDSSTIEILKKKFNLQRLAHHNPKMGFINDDAAIEFCCKFIHDHPSDYVFLAVGSPQQEILASRISEFPGCKGVGFCIGASLLFLTGQEKRAPHFFSTMGIEWLYRLIQNPKRLWRRYFHDLKIFKLALNTHNFKAEDTVNSRKS